MCCVVSAQGDVWFIDENGKRVKAETFVDPNPPSPPIRTSNRDQPPPSVPEPA